MGDLETEAARRRGEDVRHRWPDAPGVRDDDDLELQAFRRMDRQEADGIPSLLLRHGIGLLGARAPPALDEAHEALEVGAAQLSYERARRASLRRFA
jgi:hypothetical protein